MHSHLLANIRACLSTILQNLVVGGFGIGDKVINICLMLLRKGECHHCSSHRVVKTNGVFATT